MEQVHTNTCPEMKIENRSYIEIVVLKDIGSETEKLNTTPVTKNFIDVIEIPMNHPPE